MIERQAIEPVTRVSHAGARWLFVAGAMLALAGCGGGGGDGNAEPPLAAEPKILTVTGPDGASVSFSEVALPAALTVRIARDGSGAPPLPPVFVPAGDLYAVTPAGLPLRALAVVRIPIDPATPADAPIGLATSNPDGTWTLRGDTRRDGATLEVTSAQLGHFQPVRVVPTAIAAAARPGALAAGRPRPALVGNFSFGLRLSAPGFADDGIYLTNAVPYPAPTTLRVTVTREELAPIPEGYEFCDTGLGVTIQSNIAFGGAPQNQWTQPYRDLPFLAPGPGPWQFDMPIYRPLLQGAQPVMTTTVTVRCESVNGLHYSLSGTQVLKYTVTTAGALAFFDNPDDAVVPPAGSVAFEVRILGGAVNPTIGDEYALTWERSDDGGSGWSVVGYAFQENALDASPTAGRLHRYTLANVAASDDGALFRARACMFDCVVSDTARLVVSAGALAPPVIMQQPRSLSTLAGQTADFTVGATGSGRTVTWQVLAADLSSWIDVGSPGASWPGATPNAATLVTAPGTPAEDGWLFRAVVRNAGGTVVSDAVVWRVTARAVAPTITVQPAALRVPVGSPAVLAIAAEGTAPLSYQWSKDGAGIPGATSPVLSIGSAQPAQSGSYRVTVVGPGGAATSTPVELAVDAVTPTGWQFLPSHFGGLFYDVVMVGGDPRRIVALASDGSIRRSTDGGLTWSIAYAIPTGGRLVFLYKVRFADAAVGVAIGDTAILRTGDGGASWTTVWRAEDQAIPNQTTLAAEWLDANTVVAVGLGRQWRSTDRGLTWQVFGNADFAALQLGAIGGVRFADANRGVIASPYRMLRTTDGGQTWVELPGAFTTFTDPLYGLVRGNAPGVLVACGGGGLYRSTDFGATWTRTAVSGYLLGLTAHGGEMVAVGELGLVMRSSDDGATWSVEAGLPFGQLWGVDFSGGTMVVGGAGGVIARHD
jgi:hypothetical protein